ncbi:hypothetical protein FGB62_19g127 [Gracilaria domingensis]|nr:hypothetical protein FGB62_19g127 [Gracilaria domingensis]
MRALVSNAGASIEPTGCLGECGNGPNVAIETCDSVHVSIEKHIDCVEQAVGLLGRLKFDIDERMILVAEEKERGDLKMVKGMVGCAGEHYENAIDLMDRSESPSSARSVQFRNAILCNWAQSLVKNSGNEKALSLVNEAIEAQADCVAAWKWKAVAQEGKGELDMAKEKLEDVGKAFWENGGSRKMH